jgi:hypothetical protein
MTMGLLNTPLGRHAKGGGSARLNAQNSAPEVRGPQNRRGLLGSPQPVTSGSPDFIQRLLLLLRMINRVDRRYTL